MVIAAPILAVYIKAQTIVRESQKLLSLAQDFYERFWLLCEKSEGDLTVIAGKQMLARQ